LWSAIDVVPSREKTYKFLIEKKMVKQSKKHIRRIESELDKTQHAESVKKDEVENLNKNLNSLGGMHTYLNFASLEHYQLPS